MHSRRQGTKRLLLTLAVALASLVGSQTTEALALAGISSDASAPIADAARPARGEVEERVPSRPRSPAAFLEASDVDPLDLEDEIDSACSDRARLRALVLDGRSARRPAAGLAAWSIPGIADPRGPPASRTN